MEKLVEKIVETIEKLVETIEKIVETVEKIETASIERISFAWPFATLLR